MCQFLCYCIYKTIKSKNENKIGVCLLLFFLCVTTEYICINFNPHIVFLSNDFTFQQYFTSILYGKQFTFTHEYRSVKQLSFVEAVLSAVCTHFTLKTILIAIRLIWYFICLMWKDGCDGVVVAALLNDLVL